MTANADSIKHRVEVQVSAMKTLAHSMEQGAERLIHETEAQAVRDWAAALRSISDALTRAVNQEPGKVRFWNRAGVRLASGVMGAVGLGLVGGVGEGIAEGLLSGDAEVAVQVQVIVEGAEIIEALCKPKEASAHGRGDDGYGQSDGLGAGRGQGRGVAHLLDGEQAPELRAAPLRSDAVISDGPDAAALGAAIVQLATRFTTAETLDQRNRSWERLKEQAERAHSLGLVEHIESELETVRKRLRPLLEKDNTIFETSLDDLVRLRLI